KHPHSEKIGRPHRRCGSPNYRAEYTEPWQSHRYHVRSELVVCVHTVLAKPSVATRAGSANCIRGVGVGTTDRGAAMLNFLVLVDEGNIQRFDRLIGAAEDEVLVPKVGIDVSA